MGLKIATHIGLVIARVIIHYRSAQFASSNEDTQVEDQIHTCPVTEKPTMFIIVQGLPGNSRNKIGQQVIFMPWWC